MGITAVFPLGLGILIRAGVAWWRGLVGWALAGTLLGLGAGLIKA